jgi:hypothetical protein
VLQHEMGKIIEIGDSDGLASALLEILKNPADYKRDPAPILHRYVPDSIAVEYETLFEEIRKELI